MDTDFALIDFALIDHPPVQVAQALGRGASGDETLDLLHIQPKTMLGPGPLQHHPGAPPRDLIRVTGPLQGTSLSLIEFVETDGTRAHLCAQLSRHLPHQEVFYFRLSGQAVQTQHFAFHVYQNGLTSRRASARRVGDDGPWQNEDAGIFHPLEPLEADGPIVTPQRQAHVLKGLGLDADTLFDGVENRTTVLILSPDPSGAPLSEASALGGPSLVAPAAFSETAQPPALQTPPASPAPSKGWEGAVMTILTDTLANALPEDQHNGWLDSFSAQIQDGAVCEALVEAHILIAHSKRSVADRLRASAELARLFADAHDT